MTKHTPTLEIFLSSPNKCATHMGAATAISLLGLVAWPSSRMIRLVAARANLTQQQAEETFKAIATEMGDIIAQAERAKTEDGR